MTFGDAAKVDPELSETLSTLHTARNVQGSSSNNAVNIPTFKINVKTEHASTIHNTFLFFTSPVAAFSKASKNKF